MSLSQSVASVDCYRLTEPTSWRFGVVVAHWFRSTKLTYAEAGYNGMGDCVWVRLPEAAPYFRYVISQLGRLSLLPSVGR